MKFNETLKNMLSWVTKECVETSSARSHLKNRLCFLSSYTHNLSPYYHWACPINSILKQDDRYGKQEKVNGNWVKSNDLKWRSNLNYLIL